MIYKTRSQGSLFVLANYEKKYAYLYLHCVNEWIVKKKKKSLLRKPRMRMCRERQDQTKGCFAVSIQPVIL